MANLGSGGGGVTGPAIAVVTTAGAGGFWAPTVFDPEDASTAAVVTSVANQVKVHQFVLPFRIGIGKCTIEVTTAEAGMNVVAGFYDSSGNKLVQTDGMTTAAAAPTFVQDSFTAYVMEPGVYFYAYSCDGTTAQCRHLNTDLGSSAASFMNQGTATRIGTAANAMAALVLPATLGVITTVATQDAMITYWEV